MSFKFCTLLCSVGLALSCMALPSVETKGQGNRAQKDMIPLGRLLIGVDPQAVFSAEDFSEASGANILYTDPRNVFCDLEDDFLNKPFLILSQMPCSKTMGTLGVRYGYRFEIVGSKSESLEQALTRVKALRSLVPGRSSQLTKISLPDAQSLYALIGKIDKVLTANKLHYWAGRETLLGAMLFKGQIPWENGCSFFILDDDRAAFLALEASFEAEGMKIVPYFKGFFKVCLQDGIPIPNVNKKGAFQPFTYPCADFFVVCLERFHEAEDIYTHQAYDVYWNWNKDRFTYDQISRLLRVKFGPVKVFIPSNPESYLDIFYGSAANPKLWKRYAQEPWWNHKLEKNYPRNGAALVELDDKTCAPWQ